LRGTQADDRTTAKTPRKNKKRNFLVAGRVGIGKGKKGAVGTKKKKCSRKRGDVTCHLKKTGGLRRERNAAT